MHLHVKNCALIVHLLSTPWSLLLHSSVCSKWRSDISKPWSKRGHVGNSQRLRQETHFDFRIRKLQVEDHKEDKGQTTGPFWHQQQAYRDGIFSKTGGFLSPDQTRWWKDERGEIAHRQGHRLQPFQRKFAILDRKKNNCLCLTGLLKLTPSNWKILLEGEGSWGNCFALA